MSPGSSGYRIRAIPRMGEMMATTSALNDRRQLHRDANKALDDNLMAEESVRVVIRGTSDSAIIGTDRRAFVFKRGWLSGAALGKKLASWDYANITGVQLETGKMSGVALIQAPGVPAVDVSYWSSGNNSAQKAPNSVALTSDHFDQARLGTAELRRLIAERQAVDRAPHVAAPDVMGQLRQLGVLHHAGVLTGDEFEAKKSELLARL